jgi:hypothetical protein
MEYQRILNYINFSRVTPDGSSRSIFRRLCSRSFMVVEMLSGSYHIHRSFFTFIVASLFSIGCALSAPDGSSPRGYSREIFPGYRLKGYEFFFLVHSLPFVLALKSEALESKARFSVLSLIFFLLSSASCRIELLCKYFMGLVFAEAR